MPDLPERAYEKAWAEADRLGVYLFPYPGSGAVESRLHAAVNAVVDAAVAELGLMEERATLTELPLDINGRFPRRRRFISPWLSIAEAEDA